MKETLVRAVEFTDVRGNKQKYIMIGDVSKQVIINVGEKTYEGVKKLMDEAIEEKEEEVPRGTYTDVKEEGKEMNMQTGEIVNKKKK